VTGGRADPVTDADQLTSATKPSVQLDLESGTICRRTSDSRTCQTAVSDSRWRRFYFGHSGTKAQCEQPFLLFKLRFRNRQLAPSPTGSSTKVYGQPSIRYRAGADWFHQQWRNLELGDHCTNIEIKLSLLS